MNSQTTHTFFASALYDLYLDNASKLEYNFCVCPSLSLNPK